MLGETYDIKVPHGRGMGIALGLKTIVVTSDLVITCCNELHDALAEVRKSDDSKKTMDHVKVMWDQIGEQGSREVTRTLMQPHQDDNWDFIVLESIVELCIEVSKSNAMKLRNFVFLSGSSITLDKTQAAMKRFVSEIEKDHFNSDMFSIIIQPFVIGQTWALNIWDFQLRKSRCLIFNMADDKDDYDMMKDVMNKRWKKFLKVGLKMVGKYQYVEEKSPWSHEIKKVTFKGNRDKNSRSYSLVRVMIVMYHAAFNH